MTPTPDQTRTIAQLLIKLGALKISSQFEYFDHGPIVTTYYFTLSAAVPVAKILKAEEDLALAVGAPSVLISRIGGHIAIAIPNREKQIVSYDNCLHSLFTNCTNFRLPIMLGVSTMGQPIFIDLVESPHILMAGSTGGGKSVLLSAIISGLVTYNTSQQMKLMLVDTKQLDLTLFADLPHVVEVADNVEKVHALFTRLMSIVRQRTEKMKGIARNLDEYNRIVETKLPYYVVIIDELADVIGEDAAIAASRQEPITGYPRISKRLQNLIQISRAAGVHVICATQRPSVKIITGDIKANLTTRIALRLPTGHDSKTIINEYGAEKLLGKGDMLVEGPMFDQITRFHGPFVSLGHITNVLINCEQIRDSYRRMQYADRANV